MMYQIQYRHVGEGWRNYEGPVPVLRADYVRAQCVAVHPDCEVRLVPGTTVEDAQYNAQLPESWEDRRRWAIEKGPGGDHDEPYFFRLPLDGKVRDAWLRLAARWRRGEFREDAA